MFTGFVYWCGIPLKVKLTDDELMVIRKNRPHPNMLSEFYASIIKIMLAGFICQPGKLSVISRYHDS